MAKQPLNKVQLINVLNEMVIEDWDNLSISGNSFQDSNDLDISQVLGIKFTNIIDISKLLLNISDVLDIFAMYEQKKSNIRFLSITECKLLTIPNKILAMKHLEFLRISSTYLTSFRCKTRRQAHLSAVCTSHFSN